MDEPKKKISFWASLPIWGRVLLVLGIGAALIPVGYFGLFFLLILFVVLPVNMLPGAVGLAVALLLGVVALLCRGGWRKGFQRASAGVALVSLVALVGTYGWNTYQKSITIVDNSNIDTSLYLPFEENSQIARLEGEASLRFSA